MTNYQAEVALDWLLNWLPDDAALIPLRPRQKRPLSKGWTECSRVSLESPDFRNQFAGEVGIGLLCGVASNGLCLIDIDQDNWIAPAERRLPQLLDAPMVVGARGAKWLVRVPDQISGAALRTPTGERIGEFLSSRQQGVLAGIHPITQQPFIWVRVSQVPVVKWEVISAAFSVV